MYIIRGRYDGCDVARVVFDNDTDYKLYLNTLQVHLDEYKKIASNAYIAFEDIVKMFKERYFNKTVIIYGDEIDTVLTALFEICRLSTHKPFTHENTYKNRLLEKYDLLLGEIDDN